ncbi:hypothetical protein F2P81_003143 [Scophthalmus maximus]|uniref:Uncharacterized protein n=1 Tax=Scophthalmus maximus TaxID=52904 RepID=A0A6A4TFG8_SCOMX|nr:hypothetical protein F2P81_003143 [Scophthalmus maximus]
MHLKRRLHDGVDKNERVMGRHDSSHDPRSLSTASPACRLRIGMECCRLKAPPIERELIITHENRTKSR